MLLSIGLAIFLIRHILLLLFKQHLGMVAGKGLEDIWIFNFLCSFVLRVFRCLHHGSGVVVGSVALSSHPTKASSCIGIKILCTTSLESLSPKTHRTFSSLLSSQESSSVQASDDPFQLCRPFKRSNQTSLTPRYPSNILMSLEK